MAKNIIQKGDEFLQDIVKVQPETKVNPSVKVHFPVNDVSSIGGVTQSTVTEVLNGEMDSTNFQSPEPSRSPSDADSGGGSSDFSVATVTVIPDGLPDGVEMADAILTGEIILPFYVAEEQKYICQSVMTQNGILQILMYHNIAAYAGSFEFKGTDHKDYIQSNAPICTGGVIYDEDEEIIIISGDGTITVPVEWNR